MLVVLVVLVVLVCKQLDRNKAHMEVSIYIYADKQAVRETGQVE